MDSTDLHAVTLGEIDRDGAITGAVSELWDASRADFVRGAVIGGGTLLGALSVTGGVAQAAGAGKRDASILNYALGLEYLQAAFYTEAERRKSLKGETARQARTVGGHERAHVTALKGVLGSRAIGKPSFDFRGVTESQGSFRRTAVAFEDLSVAAYAAQAPQIESKPYLVAALGILSVEARHASWIRRLAGQTPAADAFDEPRDRAGVIKLVRATRFVSTRARPQTTSRRSPRFTG